jgi:preprotein translocase subunit SecA
MHGMRMRFQRRDVDYVVKNGSIDMVDEFKGRIAKNRRWPAGLQSVVEAKQTRFLPHLRVENAS